MLDCHQTTERNFRNTLEIQGRTRDISITNLENITFQKDDSSQHKVTGRKKGRKPRRETKTFVLPSCSKRSSRKIIPKKEIYSPTQSTRHSFYQTSFSAKTSSTYFEETRICHKKVLTQTSRSTKHARTLKSRKKASQVEFYRSETFSKSHFYKDRVKPASKGIASDKPLGAIDLAKLDELKTKIGEIINSSETTAHYHSAPHHFDTSNFSATCRKKIDFRTNTFQSAVSNPAKIPRLSKLKSLCGTKKKGFDVLRPHEDPSSHQKATLSKLNAFRNTMRKSGSVASRSSVVKPPCIINLSKFNTMENKIQREKEKIANLCSEILWESYSSSSSLKKFNLGRPLPCVICRSPTARVALSQFDRASCRACLQFYSGFLYHPSIFVCYKQGKCALHTVHRQLRCKACWLKSCLRLFPVSLLQQQLVLENLPRLPNGTPLVCDLLHLDQLKAALASTLDGGFTSPGSHTWSSSELNLSVSSREDMLSSASWSPWRIRTETMISSGQEVLEEVTMPKVSCAICSKSNEFLECAECGNSFHPSCLPASCPRDSAAWVCPRCSGSPSQSSSDSGLGGLTSPEECCPLCGNVIHSDHSETVTFCCSCRSWAHTSCTSIPDLLPCDTFCNCQPPELLLDKLSELLLKFSSQGDGRTTQASLEQIAQMEAKLEHGSYTAVWEVCRDVKRLGGLTGPLKSAHVGFNGNSRSPWKLSPANRTLHSKRTHVAFKVSQGCARTKAFTPSPPSPPKEALPETPAEPELSHLPTVDLPIALQMKLLQANCKTSLLIHRSPIHGMGLFSRKQLSPGDLIIEYAGELIRSIVADKRERSYLEHGLGCYMFRIDEEWVVDATLCGNPARYINHSCDPNCYSEVFDIGGSKHILILALKLIQTGEELTYDYKFPEEETGKIPCNCAADSCRHFLN